VFGAQSMPARTKVVRHRCVHRQEALRMAHRLEAPHAPFALSGRLMRVLSPVVQPSTAPMLHCRQKLIP